MSTYYRKPFTQRKSTSSTKGRTSRYYQSAPKVAVGRGFKGVYNRPPAEKKFVDTGFNTAVADNAPAVLPLNIINEGTSVSQRVGRKVAIKSVQVRGKIVLTGTNDTGVGCRLMLVWDKQVNGVIATAPDILSDAQGDDPYAFMNLDNRERFVVLMDKQYTFAPMDYATVTPNSPGPISYNVKKYKSMAPDTYTIFDGTGAGIADISTGALLMVMVSDAANASNVVLPYLRFRIRYTDA